ncbi:MAG: penicillin-binding protein 2 [Treponema sp.]|jgi:penicillin-binding protein 2|nr:penicillin-binding protein 2 [Treponema sp.]
MGGLSLLPSQEPQSALRINIITGIFIVIFLVYGFTLFNIQIVQGETFRSKAQNIVKSVIVIPSQRGEIYDRNFRQPLAVNVDSFAITITPAEINRSDIPALIEKLSGVIGIPKEQIDRKLPSSIYYLYQPVEVASYVPFETVAALAEQADTLPGVAWQSKPIRNYPADTGSLSHVIGYVGDITREELTMLYNQGYHRNDIIGKAGVERQYDELLRGKNGQETRTVDVRGRRISNEDSMREAPEAGKNLTLTIDRDIQTLAEKALGDRIGAIVVMRPTTGEILAMVSYPWYDPGIFNRSDVNREYDSLINDPDKPFLNRAVQSSYPPASTFKIIMTSAILEENAFSPDQKILCAGEFEYGGRMWRCHIRKPGHGWLSLSNAMAQSCDIYYWTVGRDALGVERIASYAEDFGFGSLANIDLPGEIPGFIPTPQWKDRRFHERWLGGDTMNISIGQGFMLVTPIQMANMVAMTVNEGVIYTPHLLKEVRNPHTGAVEETVEPTVLHRSDISPDVFRAVKRDMRGVIDHGTAQYPLNIRSVQIAGKTGTGEMGLQDQWHSWFAAFAPYETSAPEERIVVSVIVEAVNKWEWWAPYASAIIFQGIFANQTYEEAVAALRFQYLMPVTGRRE